MQSLNIANVSRHSKKNRVSQIINQKFQPLTVQSDAPYKLD
jgi:hypothetical protein